MLWILLFVFTTISAAPTYFTIWLNNGARIAPYLEQLKDQNRRFNDMLIVDANVQPFVTGHSRVVLDRTVFTRARTAYPLTSQKISKLEEVYDLLKPLNPAAASDILRFVGFMGLEGNEFVYHDVDVKIGTTFEKTLTQPISSAMIGTRDYAFLTKNWIIRAVSLPTKEINLVGANINTDLIAVVKSEAITLLTEYVDKACNFFDNSLNKVFVSESGTRKTLREILTTVSTEKFTLENIDDYLFITGGTVESTEIRTDFAKALSRKTIQAKFVFGASITQYESILQRIFDDEYYTPLPSRAEHDPYAVVDRKIKFMNLVLRGEPKGIINFVRDYIADPLTFGATSRKNNVDWQGVSTGPERDVATLDSDPVDAEHDEEVEDDLTDYEDYDENLDVRALDDGVITIDSTQLFCGHGRKRRGVVVPCVRNNPEKYTLNDERILFDGKMEITFVSRYVYIHNVAKYNDRSEYRRYKYEAAEAVRQKLTDLKQRITARLERALRLPSGRQAMFELRNQYERLESSSGVSRKYVPSYGVGSPLIRRFNRMRFAVGYSTALAFSTQFLAQAVASDIDITRKIALGTIGSAGLAELSYASATKIAGLFSKTVPLSVAAKFGGAFKFLHVATAIYFVVDSSITLSKNPTDLEAWYWLSRGVTMFTPLNKIFVPIDISLIVSKQLVSASWDLALVQNNVLLNQPERSHFYALRFFGVTTQWISNVQNGGVFKVNVVNPTVSKLRSLLTDAYGVVGYPTTTVCVSSEKMIQNTYNDYDTDLKNLRMASVSTVRDSLSPARMLLCLQDAETQCAPQELEGWDWFLAVISQASRVRHRGVDLGVGCVLQDGTTLSGDACSKIDRMRQDIRDREKIFVVIEGSDEYVLPYVNPDEYNFNFMSVANGSVVEFSAPECSSGLKWSKTVAPYVLTDPQKYSGRIDYIGVPAGKSGNVEMTTIDGYPARVYVYKPNKNGKRDFLTVSATNSRDNEFVLLEIEDYWTLKGPNSLIVRPTNVTATVSTGSVSINDMVTVLNSSAMSVASSTIVVGENQTSPVLYLTDCSVTAKRSSNSFVVGRGNVLRVEEYAIVNAYMDGGTTDITTAALTGVVLNATDQSASAVIRSNLLSKFVIVGLSDDWTVQRSNTSITVDNRLRVLSGSVILLFRNYSIITSVEYGRDTVIFSAEKAVEVLRKLSDPIVMSFVNDSLVDHIKDKFTVPRSKHAFFADDKTNVTIPYSTSKKLNFYGAPISIVNDMIDCGSAGACEFVAHYNCTEAVEVCRFGA